MHAPEADAAMEAGGASMAVLGETLERLLQMQPEHPTGSNTYNHNAAAAQSAADIRVVMGGLDLARATLVHTSLECNARALGLVGALPRELRDQLLRLIVLKTPHGVCVAEAYDHMLRLRQDMRGQAACEPLYLRLSEALTFCDEQDEMRACIEAHRVAAAAFGMVHALGAVPHHELCGGHGCCFRIIMSRRRRRLTHD